LSIHSNSTPERRSDTTRVIKAIPLIAIMALGLAARLYRLNEQSFWYDDYNVANWIEEPDLRSYLAATYAPGSVNREHVPLYFIGEYVVSALFGKTPVAMRWFAVLTSLLTMPVLYALGRELFGRRAGLMATFCFALSPIHIFHAQGLRPYSMMAFVSALSIYTFARALRTQGLRWSIANVLVNIALLWTHIFGVFLLFTEGLTLLFLGRRHIRRTLAWGGVHAIAIVPSAIWVVTMVSMPDASYEHYHPPTPQNVLLDVLADDAPDLNLDLLPSEETWEFLPESVAKAFMGAEAWFGYALLLLSTLGTFWVARRTVAASPKPHSPDATRAQGLFLLAVIFVPVIILAVLSYIWRPCIFPRYTLYSSLALYAAIGGAVSAIPQRSLRYLAVAAVLVLYSYQAARILPTHTRTRWIEAADHVRSGAGPDDIVYAGLAHGSPYRALDIFRYHMGETGIPILPCQDLADFCDKATCLTNPEAPAEFNAGKARHVWGVLQQDYRSAPLPELETCLESRGLSFAHHELQGMECLIIYDIARTREVPIPEPPPSCADVFGEVGMQLTDLGDYERAVPALQAASVLSEDYARMFSGLITAVDQNKKVIEAAAGIQRLYQGRQLLGRKDYGKAVEAFREAMEADPDFATARWELGGALADRGLALIREGKYDEAKRALVQAGETNPDYVEVFGELVAALDTNTRVPDSLAAVERLREGYARLGGNDYEVAIAAFRDVLARNPSFRPARHALTKALGDWGLALAEQGRDDEAIKTLRDAADLSPDSGRLFEDLIKAIEQKSDVSEVAKAVRSMHTAREYLGRQDFDKAVEAFQAAVAANPTYREAQWELGGALADRGLALAGKGQLEEAIEALTQAGQMNPDYVELFSDLIAAIRERRDITIALDTLRKLREAHALLATGDREKAMVALRNALTLTPEFAPAKRELVLMLTESGLDLANRGNYAEATALLNEVSEEDADLGAMLQHLVDAINTGNDVPAAAKAAACVYEGRKSLAKRDFDGALESLRAAVAADEHDALARLELAGVLADRGLAAVVSKDNGQGLSLLGEAVSVNANYEEILGSLVAALEQGSDIEYWLTAVLRLRDSYVLSAGGKYDEAVAALDEALAAAPDYILAKKELARLLVRWGIDLAEQGRQEDSLKALRRAGELDAEHTAVLSSLVDALVTDAGVPAAAQSVRSLMEARECFGRKDYEAAIAAYREVVETDPSHTLARQELGGALEEYGLRLAEDGTSAKAGAILREAVRIQPADAEVFEPILAGLDSGGGVTQAVAATRCLLEGRAARDAHRKEEAIALFRRALAAESDFGLAQRELARTLAERGLDLAEQGARDEALEALREATQLDEQYAPLLDHVVASLEGQRDAKRAAQAVRLLQEGRTRIGQEDLEGAAASFRSALVADPEYAEARWDLGCVLARLASNRALAGDRDSALSAISESVALGGEHAEVGDELLRALTEGGPTEDSARATLAVVRAFSAIGNGLVEDALGALNEATSLAPRYAYALFMKGQLCAHTNNLTAAKEAFERYGKLRPESAPALLALGIVLLMQGDRDRGARCLLEALALDSSATEPFTTLVKLTFQDKDPAKARQELERLRDAAEEVPPALAQAVENLAGDTP